MCSVRVVPVCACRLSEFSIPALSYLGKVVHFKADTLGVPTTRVHVVSHEKHELEDPVKFAALLHLFQGSRGSHDILQRDAGNTANLHMKSQL